jgi:hypothetical protein
MIELSGHDWIKRHVSLAKEFFAVMLAGRETNGTD